MNTCILKRAYYKTKRGITLKSKYSVIRFILGILIMILAIGTLTDNVDSKIVMPYMFICLGIFQILMAYIFISKIKNQMEYY